MRLKAWCLAALLPLGGSIAIPQYVPLEARNEAAIKDIRLMSVVHQDEIYLSAASPGVTAAAGGGLIASLVESQIANLVDALANGRLQSQAIKDRLGAAETEANALYRQIEDARWAVAAGR